MCKIFSLVPSEKPVNQKKKSGDHHQKFLVDARGQLTLKTAEGGGFCPELRRSPAISHRIILWSQNFLTLSKNIPSTRQSSHFFTILTGVPEIQPRPSRDHDFLGSKITKSIFFNFFTTKSPNFISNLNDDCSQLSFEVYNICVAHKLQILLIFIELFKCDEVASCTSKV